MTVTYWEMGRHIVEFEQRGSPRAVYGESLISRLSADLTKRFGRGFGPVNLSQMKKFYLAWPAERIFQTPSEKSRSIFQTASGISSASTPHDKAKMLTQSARARPDDAVTAAEEVKDPRIAGIMQNIKKLFAKEPS